MASHVKVYALTTCVHCRKTKEFLDECGVEYDCIHVDDLKGEERTKCIDEVRSHNPAVSFPTIVIDGEKVVVGFRKDKLKDLLGV
jgi:glutaredoxin